MVQAGDTVPVINATVQAEQMTATGAVRIAMEPERKNAVLAADQAMLRIHHLPIQAAAVPVPAAEAVREKVPLT
jgi:hypothetical protein